MTDEQSHVKQIVTLIMNDNKIPTLTEREKVWNELYAEVEKTRKRLREVKVDELPATPGRKEPTGQNCRKAIGLGNNPGFIKWAGVGDKEGADEYLRCYFKIKSKRELDDDPFKAKLFEQWWAQKPWLKS